MREKQWPMMGIRLVFTPPGCGFIRHIVNDLGFFLYRKDNYYNHEYHEYRSKGGWLCSKFL